MFSRLYHSFPSYMNSAFYEFVFWTYFNFNEWIETLVLKLEKLKTILFSFWQITLICLNSKQTKFISSSVHQTKLNFNLSIDFQAELDEVIIKFVHHPVSTDKLENWQGC